MTSSTNPDVSERLAHTFACWQIAAFAHESWALAEGKNLFADDLTEARIKMGHRLIPAIMNQRIKEIRFEEWQPLFSNEKVYQTLPGCLAGEYATFPLEIFQWNRNSRRVFHLPHTLIAALSSATYGEITWDKITWPHDSFVITLERPLRLEVDGVGEDYDTIMVNLLPFGVDGSRVPKVRLFQAPKKQGVRLGLTRSALDRYLTVLKRKQWMKAYDICEKEYAPIAALYPTIPGSCGVTAHYQSEDEKVALEIDLEDLWEGVTAGDKKPAKVDNMPVRRAKAEIGLVALRIAVGWSLYLETMSTDRVKTCKNPHPPKQLSGGYSGTITNPEEVFHILGQGRITKASEHQQRRLVEEGGFVRPHWRRAHKKRPAKSPPDAPKSVKVLQKLIREDLVPLFGIIGGTRSVMFLNE